MSRAICRVAAGLARVGGGWHSVKLGMGEGDGTLAVLGGAPGRWKRLWTRVRDLWPLTRLGLFVIGLSIGGLYYYGFGQLDLVWYVAALAGLGATCLCLLGVLAGSAWMARDLKRVQPAVTGRFVTGVPFLTGFTPTRLRSWPLLETAIQWAHPGPVQLRLETEGWRFRERAALEDHGEFRRVRRRVSVRDVLGLSALTLESDMGVQWDVTPHLGALREVPWLASLSGGDDIPHPMGIAAGDRLELRRYGPGDPARFIHWKAYARTRKLVVRVPERALSRAHRTAAYLVPGLGDGATAAASLAAAESGAFGADWVFGADGSSQTAISVEQVQAAVRRSAAARAFGGRGLESFVREASEQGPVALMLFVPPRAGAWEDAVVRVLGNSLHRPRVVIGVDHVQQPTQQPLWARVALVREISPDAVLADEVRALAGRLAAKGAEVWVADRKTGRLLAAQQLVLTGSKRRVA